MPVLLPPEEGPAAGLGVGPQYVEQITQQVLEQLPQPDTISKEELAQIIGKVLGGSGFGGFGSGGGSAPVDPTVAAAEQFYFQLWGRKPPEGYIESFIRQGHDLFDFMRWQLSRPGADNQQFYRDQFARYASIAAQVFGRR
jgi:hypothetical protein